MSQDKRNITTVATRRRMFKDKKYWFTSNAIKSTYDGKWSNTLYLHFAKEDFPMIKSPNLKPCDWGEMKQRFDYSESVLNGIEFHKGITFYEETRIVDLEKTFVKVGCDYQHYMDDHYQLDDNGEMLLGNTADELAKQFEALVLRLNKDTKE